MSAAGVSVAPPFVGTYLNTLLYSLEVVGAYVYFFRDTRSKSDPLFIKGAILLSLLSDTLGTIASIAMLYIFLLVFPTMNPPSITRLYWPFELWISTNMISAAVFQCFMVTRYFRLSGNWILSFLIFLLIGTSFGSTIHLLAIYDTVIPALFSTEAASFYSARFIILVLATAMTTDILISSALIWQLHRTEILSPHTKSLIHRISTQTIKTGTIPCLFAMVVLITYLAYKDGSVSVCFAFMLGRVYTLTMLFTLIFRDSLVRPSANNTLPAITFIDVERLGGKSQNGALHTRSTENGGLATETVDSTVVADSPRDKTAYSLPSIKQSSSEGKEQLGTSPAGVSVLNSASNDEEKKEAESSPALAVEKGTTKAA
ncbi:hypothetical protein BJ165DRAFT_1530199 [Panaeolus papilionaceus]|nr:hypothetical protein BJ165DRAFT_1530199 [Panaeolus papilionaceus]